MKPYKNLITPLLSLVILTIGSALLTTFLSLKLHHLGVSDFFIGGLSTAYYAGMVIGAFRLELIILKVGHIRAYAAFASLVAVISILHGFYINTYCWLLLRFTTGIATAGLYIVIESWILGATESNKRGASLALYMLALYTAQAMGQWLLNLGHQNSLILYCIAGICASLSVIPLSLTKAATPTFSEPETLSIKRMIKLSPSGVITCFIAGMLLGSLYGLYPIFIQKAGYPIADISTIMGLTILGGMMFQYPFGKLSDRISRRLIIAILCLASTALAILLLLFATSNVYLIASLSFLLGGTTFCLYPIGISHACDRVNDRQIISATQTLLLAYGVGAVLGPIITPLFNSASHRFGILLFIMTASLALGVFALSRRQVKPSVPIEEKHDFVLAAETTPVASELDPRSTES